MKRNKREDKRFQIEQGIDYTLHGETSETDEDKNLHKMWQTNCIMVELRTKGTTNLRSKSFIQNGRDDVSKKGNNKSLSQW